MINIKYNLFNLLNKKMKYLIFVYLMNFLYGYFNIYFFNKYESLNGIDGNNGIIALNLSKFDLGDTIYITYSFTYLNFESRDISPLKYTFSNNYSETPELNILNETVSPYSTSASTSLSARKLKYYGENYYKIVIPKNITKTNYILLGYNLYKSTTQFNFDNTRYSRYTVTIIVGVFVGVFVIAVIILIIFRHRIISFFARKFSKNEKDSNNSNNSKSNDINNVKTPENNCYQLSNKANGEEKLNEENNYPENEEVKNNSDINEFTEKPYYSDNNNNYQDNEDAPPQPNYYPTNE